MTHFFNYFLTLVSYVAWHSFPHIKFLRLEKYVATLLDTRLSSAE